MAAILKIVISPYLSEKSSDFDEILYTAADFELDERHVIKNEKKLHWTDSEFDRTYFLLNFKILSLLDSAENLRRDPCYMSHHTYNVSQHYLVKNISKIAKF